MQHSRLGASGSSKWLSCSAALATEEMYGIEDRSSHYADEGTVAHHIGSECLDPLKDAEPSEFLGKFFGVNSEGEVLEVDEIMGDDAHEVTEEMIEAVEIYINYVKNLKDVTTLIEKRVDYSHIAPEGFGTSDAIVEVEGGILEVTDLKYGKGVKVSATENTQGMLYAIGALETYGYLFENEIHTIRITIVQPRMDNIDTWSIPVKDLLEWGEKEVKPKAELAHSLMQKGAEIKEEHFNPTTKGCQWCSAKSVCRARAAVGYKTALDGFDDVTDLTAIEVSKDATKNVALLNNTELAAAYKSMKIFDSWLKELSATILKKLEDGEDVPGLTLARGVGNRTWSLKGEELIKALRSAGLQKKDFEKIGIISPTESEKILKKVKPNDHEKRYKKLEEKAIIRPKGALKIVKSKDDNMKKGF